MDSALAIFTVTNCSFKAVALLRARCPRSQAFSSRQLGKKLCTCIHALQYERINAKCLNFHSCFKSKNSFLPDSLVFSIPCTNSQNFNGTVVARCSQKHHCSRATIGNHEDRQRAIHSAFPRHENAEWIALPSKPSKRSKKDHSIWRLELGAKHSWRFNLGQPPRQARTRLSRRLHSGLLAEGFTASVEVGNHH